MSIELKVPPLPESVADAVLVAWHKKEGEAVSRGENLVDLETDKVVLEVPAPESGVLTSIAIQEGVTVTAGQVLGQLEKGEAVQSAPAEAAAPVASEEDGDDDVRMSPSVRHLIESNGLDASRITGTGKDGRINKSDVEAFMAKASATPAPSAAPSPVEPAAQPAPAPNPATGARSSKRVPMSRLRAKIAERMVEAQHTAAMLTSFNEIDLTEVKALRAQYRDSFEEKHGVRLGFMSFFVKAAVEALKQFPAVNASIEEKDVVYHDYFDIGVAVSTERGLMVPVVRDADQLNFAQIESSIRDYALRARDGSINLDELQGGTFTITNGGVFGSLISTPILNMPQSAILGMHKIQDRPVVENGEIVIRPMMYIALTYDHRIIDGRDAVQFLVAIKEALEEPARLMLQL